MIKNMSNPLLNIFQTPFESIPFDKIENKDFLPAFLESIEKAKKEIQLIIDNEEAPNFVNTYEALELAGKDLNIISNTFFNLDSAETNDEIQEIAHKVSPLLAEYGNDILLNEALFKKLEKVHNEIDIDSLNSEQRTLLEKTFKSFTRNGALLDDTVKKELREIDQKLSVLTLEFSQNVLEETNQYVLHITDEKDLEGIPESLRQAAKELAVEKNLDGWAFSLQFPSYVPFMKYAKNRTLREEMYIAYSTRGYKNNEYNNEGIIREIVELRNKRSQLLGYNSHAEYVLAERMASTPELVYEFLYDLLDKAKPFAEKEIEKLKELALTDGIHDLMPFDHSYYAEKLKEKTFDISEEKLKAYFPLEQVKNAAFDLANSLFDLTFVKRTDIPVYHPEVEVYEVLENNKHKALLYMDWFPRKGKRPGAWMTSFKGQSLENGENYRPHISIVCNFTRPQGETPSLLTFTEVTTLFHEFGHALHGMVANTQYESLSGTQVYWDFVELPSQFMENFCYQKDFLQTFAKHYKTGEVLNDEEINKIVASSNFMEGYQTVRQIGLGLLDLSYHDGKNIPQILNVPVVDFENKQLEKTQLYPHIPNTLISTTFAHIFAGGYSAGYYSYKWAEVLDADAFEYFKEKGIFNKEIGNKFKTLMSKGGTEDPMHLYIEFRGRKPNPEALLRRAGLIEKS